jgi:hypothetical protein
VVDTNARDGCRNRIGYRAEYVLCVGIVIATIVLIVRTLLGSLTTEACQPAAPDD